MKKKLIAKLLLSTMIVPSLMSGFYHVYALPGDKSDGSKDHTQPSNEESVNKFDEYRDYRPYETKPDGTKVYTPPGDDKNASNRGAFNPGPESSSCINQNLWNKSVEAVSHCIIKDKKDEKERKILDLSKSSVFELRAHMNAIEYCIRTKGINAIRISYAQHIQSKSLYNSLRRHSIIYYLIETIRALNIPYYIDYTVPDPSLAWWNDNCICDSMLICKSRTYGVIQWIQEFDYFCGLAAKPKGFNTSQIENIISCGDKLTDKEKNMIREAFRRNGLTNDLEFIENPDANPAKAPYTQSLFDPGYTRERTRLEPVHLATIALKGRQLGSRMDILSYYDKFVDRKTGCTLCPAISKKAMQAEKTLRTIPAILARCNYNDFIRFVSKRLKEKDMIIETIDVAHTFALESSDKITDVLRKLKEAAPCIKRINIISGGSHFLSSDNYGKPYLFRSFNLNTLINFVNICKSLNIEVTSDGTIGLVNNEIVFNPNKAAIQELRCKIKSIELGSSEVKPS